MDDLYTLHRTLRCTSSLLFTFAIVNECRQGTAAAHGLALWAPADLIHTSKSRPAVQAVAGSGQYPRTLIASQTLCYDGQCSISFCKYIYIGKWHTQLIVRADHTLVLGKRTHEVNALKAPTSSFGTNFGGKYRFACCKSVLVVKEICKRDIAEYGRQAPGRVPVLLSTTICYIAHFLLA